MKDKNLVTFLNLRRNRITNDGAELLANFLIYHDTEIFKLDIQRNLITDKGALAILKAVEKTIRILDLKMYYGNCFDKQIDFDIKEEIKANM